MRFRMQQEPRNAPTNYLFSSYWNHKTLLHNSNTMSSAAAGATGPFCNALSGMILKLKESMDVSVALLLLLLELQDVSLTLPKVVSANAATTEC